MNTVYVIEVRVQPTNAPAYARYFGRVDDLNPINPEWSQSNIPAFGPTLNDALFFTNTGEAAQEFDNLITRVTEPNTGNRTLFIPPISEIVGGNHGNRTYQLHFTLVKITGESLVGADIKVVRNVPVKAEEFTNQPYRVKTELSVNLVTDGGEVAGYNLTIPIMVVGDMYRSTRIDPARRLVIHEAVTENGSLVKYECTKHGNLLQRTTLG